MSHRSVRRVDGMHKRLYGLAALGVVLAAGCSQSTSTSSTPSTGQTPGAAGGKVVQIVVIPKGTTHEYWKSVHAGAVKAEQELQKSGTNVKIIWKGPLREDDRNGQNDVVETFVTQGVQGIVLAPLDSEALVRPAEDAVAKGIPVVVMDSALD